MNDRRPLYLFVSPSLKPTGGNFELIRLAKSVAELGAGAEFVAMWDDAQAIVMNDLKVHTLSKAIISWRSIMIDLPLVFARFWKLLRGYGSGSIIFTHYLTYLLSPFVSRERRWFFVQDTEWNFVSSSLMRTFLRAFILSQLRRGRVLTANSYLTSQMTRCGVEVAGQASIWASSNFASDKGGERDVDLVVMLRRGAHKRADLVEALLAASASRGLRVALITPNDEFFEKWANRGLAQVLLRPSIPEMRALYERSLTYVLLSDHEGFGLPPLEAMGAGVVPICRPAGGVQAYMRDELQENILPKDASVEDTLVHVERLKADRQQWRRKSSVARRLFAEGLITPVRREKELRDAGFL